MHLEQNKIQYHSVEPLPSHTFVIHVTARETKPKPQPIKFLYFQELTVFFVFFLFLSFSLYKGSVEKPSTQSTVLLSPQCQYGHRSKWQIEINHNLLFPSLTLRLAFIGFNSDMPFNDWILHAQLLKNCALGH